MKRSDEGLRFACYSLRTPDHSVDPRDKGSQALAHEMRDRASAVLIVDVEQSSERLGQE